MSKGIIIAVVSLVLFLMGGFVGYSWCKRSYDAGIIKQQKEDAEIVSKHQDKQIEVVKYVDRVIVKIKEIKDPSGCLDNPSPDDYNNELLKADSEAQSSFD